MYHTKDTNSIIHLCQKKVNQKASEVMLMREGILIPDMQSGRADIRFNSDDCYGGLHCGTTMDIWLNEQWVPTRIEIDSRGWYLVGVQVETLWGQRVRICW